MELNPDLIKSLSHDIETRLAALQETYDQAIERLANQLDQERTERLTDRQRWEALEREWRGWVDRSTEVDPPSRASLLMGW
jgi:K+-sensing histidine kinase KdpD